MTTTVTVNTSATPTTVVIRTAGTQGIQGEQGASAGTITMLADGAVSGHRLVKTTTSGKVGYASSNDLLSANGILGMTLNAAADGDTLTIIQSGKVIEPSWTFTPNTHLFCGIDGTLTQTQPATGFSLVVGIAISPTEVLLGIKQPIVII